MAGRRVFMLEKTHTPAALLLGALAGVLAATLCIFEIEAVSRMRHTGIVNNSNLGKETTADTVLHGRLAILFIHRDDDRPLRR